MRHNITLIKWTPVDYYDVGVCFRAICVSYVEMFFGRSPYTIKITVTDKNPKKKGWHKFCFINNTEIRLLNRDPLNHGVIGIWRLPYRWTFERFRGGNADILNKPFFFQIKKA